MIIQNPLSPTPAQAGINQTPALVSNTPRSSQTTAETPSRVEPGAPSEQIRAQDSQARGNDLRAGAGDEESSEHFDDGDERGQNLDIRV